MSFSEAVTVTGTPGIRIKLDSGGRRATYAATPSTSTELVFHYTVKGKGYDHDGILSHDPGIHWNGGAIMRAEMNADLLTDGVGNDAAQLTDVRADVGRTVMLVQRDHTVNKVATDIELSTNPELVGEDAGALSFTVIATLNGLPLTTDTPVTVSVGATGDTATEGTDNSTVDDLTLTITAGQTSGVASFSLTPTNDAADEVNETISVTGSTTAPSLTVVGTTASIIDDDNRAASVSLAGAEADEDDGQIVFMVSLSRPVRKIVSADFETISGGTATENVDYRPQTTELMIFPGATSVQAGVSLIDDAIDDDGETVMVRIIWALMVTGESYRAPKVLGAVAG